MKLIALDVGTKRIGVAKADSAVRIAVPFSAVEVDGTEFDKIASLARAWDINCFVLGLPRNSQGEETAQSKYVRKFARDLKQNIPDAKICFQDESLTSVEAEKRLKGKKKGYKKGDVDSEAAAIILQDFLEEHAGGKKSTTKASAARHKSVKARKPHRFLTAMVVILVLLGLAGGGAFVYFKHNLQPVIAANECAGNNKTDQCKPITFVVTDGDGVSEVATNLKNAGLIRDPLVFQIYYRLKNLRGDDLSLKAGEYELTKDMTPDQIIQEMHRGSYDNTFSFMILPGETINEIKAKLVSIGYEPDAVDAAFAKDYTGKSYGWMFEGKPEEAGLEGYIFGDTYEFYTDEPVEEIIDTALQAMAKVVEANDLKTKFEAQGLTLYQGITLASIVQKEAYPPKTADDPDDQARVAQVFYNRMREDMNLGSDVTVQYAWDLANPGRDPNEVSNAEKLEIDSPYNTRMYKGLPYGPISNPGLNALKAAATPDTEFAAEYLFFLTGDDGKMYYSSTDEGHQQNIADFCQELCNVSL